MKCSGYMMKCIFQSLTPCGLGIMQVLLRLPVREPSAQTSVPVLGTRGLGTDGNPGSITTGPKPLPGISTLAVTVGIENKGRINEKIDTCH